MAWMPTCSPSVRFTSARGGGLKTDLERLFQRLTSEILSQHTQRQENLLPSPSLAEITPYGKNLKLSNLLESQHIELRRNFRWRSSQNIRLKIL